MSDRKFPNLLEEAKKCLNAHQLCKCGSVPETKMDSKVKFVINPGLFENENCLVLNLVTLKNLNSHCAEIQSC